MYVGNTFKLQQTILCCVKPSFEGSYEISKCVLFFKLTVGNVDCTTALFVCLIQILDLCNTLVSEEDLKQHLLTSQC